VSEDRFGDLGTPRAAEQLAELDEREARPPQPPRRPSGRYVWVVGVAAVIAIAVAGINSLGNAGGGINGLPPGTRLPKFAAPSATGPLDGDANVKQSAGDQGTNNETAACDVELEGAIRSCDYTSKPFVLTFIVPGAKDCEGFLDRLQRVYRSYPRVNFMAVLSGAKKGEAGSLVRKHGWTFPVVFDRNLALFNTFRVSVCATSVFAYRDGTVRRSVVETQHLSDSQLATEIRATTLR
jgi:hypothetical protein